jgi:hypothetical protein
MASAVSGVCRQRSPEAALDWTTSARDRYRLVRRPFVTAGIYNWMPAGASFPESASKSTERSTVLSHS